MGNAATLRASGLKNYAAYWVGLVILVLNKLRHAALGYTSPRAFPTSDVRRCVEYDLMVVKQWQKWWREYTSAAETVDGKSILELGPGADLGVGLILLNQGARLYQAIDVHPLALNAPAALYEALFGALATECDKAVDGKHLGRQLALALAGRPERLNYVCRPDFNISIFGAQTIDAVFSQAAFEHFDNVERVVGQLTFVTKAGAVFIGGIDLQTHTRWIRDVDPLNIYRYGDRLYELLRFRGSPNRLRPFEYVEIFQRHGWRDVRVVPVTRVDERYLRRVQPKLNRRFQGTVSRMDTLSMVLCATRA
jgi:SAM-dependent methyltransferase